MDALNRGNSAQASQLWLNMSADDRANLSHNVGFEQEISQDDIARAMLKHQKEEATKNGDGDDAASDDGDSDGQQTEIPGIGGGSNAAGLTNLPAAAAIQQIPSITTIPVQ
jgi:hypothetical protein